MKRFAIFAAAASLFSIAAFAETWNGTLVDVMCKNKDLASHTRDCAITCAKSGFGDGSRTVRYEPPGSPKG